MTEEADLQFDDYLPVLKELAQRVKGLWFEGMPRIVYFAIP